ncbi:MAG: gamma-glutamylcyclotransferase [Gammaproteobacteria bacterium]|nr:gamma-glutamylcyclotransferase [Gammaproteobacteria bacterium]
MTGAMTGLFVYGSLMAPDIMQRASGHTGTAMPARLDGYFRGTIVDETYPGIVPAEGESVSGLFYPDLGPSAVRRLDEFEGEMYERVAVEVDTAGGRIAAQAYVVRAVFRHLLTRAPWTFDAFMRNGYRRFVAEYVGFDTGEGDV